LTPALSGGKNLTTLGEGLIFKDVEDQLLAFRRIKGGKGIKVSTLDNDIIIELSQFLEVSPSSLTFESVLNSTQKLTISSNISWKLIIPPELIDNTTGWLEFDKVEGYGYSEIIATVTKENPSTSIRNSSIILRDSSGDLEDIVIPVLQNGSLFFTLKYISGNNDVQCELI